MFPQSIRQGDTGRCDENGLGSAEKWTIVSPCRQVSAECPGLAWGWPCVVERGLHHCRAAHPKP